MKVVSSGERGTPAKSTAETHGAEASIGDAGGDPYYAHHMPNYAATGSLMLLSKYRVSVQQAAIGKLAAISGAARME